MKQVKPTEQEIEQYANRPLIFDEMTPSQYAIHLRGVAKIRMRTEEREELVRLAVLKKRKYIPTVSEDVKNHPLITRSKSGAFQSSVKLASGQKRYVGTCATLQAAVESQFKYCVKHGIDPMLTVNSKRAKKPDFIANPN